MRLFLKSTVLALAVVFAVSTGTLSAQGNGPWTRVAYQQLPLAVKTSYQKHYLHTKVTKSEKSGSGPSVMYRLTIHKKGKPQVVLFDAKGKAQ